MLTPIPITLIPMHIPFPFVATFLFPLINHMGIQLDPWEHISSRSEAEAHHSPQHPYYRVPRYSRTFRRLPGSYF